jgi:hypothetical protein
VLESKAIKYNRCFNKKTDHENSLLKKIKRVSQTCKSLGDTHKELRVLSIRRGWIIDIPASF